MRSPRSVRHAAGILTLVLASVIAGAACQPAPQRCNGAAELCDRAYDAVSYPTTHNAMNNFAEGWVGANQQYGITRQLNDGVRGLMLDTHYNGTGNLSSPTAPANVPLLCHGYCTFGWKRLADGLGEITTFLAANPNEVVTIIFESYVTPADTAAAFAESGLDAYTTTHQAGTPWPTLRQMIAAGTRLVVLTDSGGGAYPWYLPVWAEAFENPYSAKVLGDLNCNLNRGNAANSLFILNNFLTDIVGRAALADQANANPGFLDRARACQAQFGHLPNFVTVDFYDRKDLFSVVRTLNGL